MATGGVDRVLIGSYRTRSRTPSDQMDVVDHGPGLELNPPGVKGQTAAMLAKTTSALIRGRGSKAELYIEPHIQRRI